MYTKWETKYKHKNRVAIQYMYLAVNWVNMVKFLKAKYWLTENNSQQKQHLLNNYWRQSSQNVSFGDKKATKHYPKDCKISSRKHNKDIKMLFSPTFSVYFSQCRAIICSHFCWADDSILSKNMLRFAISWSYMLTHVCMLGSHSGMTMLKHHLMYT